MEFPGAADSVDQSPLLNTNQPVCFREANHEVQSGITVYNPSIQSKGENQNMIARIWHGWTTPGNADKYEELLKEEIFIGIQNRGIGGFEKIQLLRRKAGEEVEFITIMFFKSLAAVREFAGEDYETAVVPAKAREVLARFDERSQHYEIRVE